MRLSACPVCDSDQGFDRRNSMETVDVRGEEFVVPASGWECRNCGEIFDGDKDPLDLAYRMYRDQHGIPQPEAIKHWREALGLTQKELADVLCWGHATLSRYENGALPTEAHGRRLAQVMTATGIADAIEAERGVLPDEKRQAVLERIHAELIIERSKQMLEAVAGGIPASLVNGMRTFCAQRAMAVTAALAEAGEFKTKLNKLLFYADFKAFKELGASITGMRYARINFGPVPDRYESVFASMSAIGIVSCEPWESETQSGEIIKSSASVDMTIFSPEERAVIVAVKARFRSMTPTEIVRFSHEEPAWKEVRNSEIIPYSYAARLQI